MTIYISYGELHIHMLFVFIFMGWERECVMCDGQWEHECVIIDS